MGPGEEGQMFQTSRESWLTWKRFSTNGTARTQWGYERVGEMRTNWRSSDSAVQGSGNFRHQRHLAAGSTSRAYSRGRCRTCLCGRASGHFAVGAPATEAHGGGQQEMGNRQRGACRVKFGGAPCESSSQGSQNRSIPSDQEERRKKQK